MLNTLANRSRHLRRRIDRRISGAGVQAGAVLGFTLLVAALMFILYEYALPQCQVIEAYRWGAAGWESYPMTTPRLCSLVK